MTIPSVDRVIAAIEEARRDRCGKLTLSDLAKEEPHTDKRPVVDEPRPSLTLAAPRD